MSTDHLELYCVMPTVWPLAAISSHQTVANFIYQHLEVRMTTDEHRPPGGWVDGRVTADETSAVLY